MPQYEYQGMYSIAVGVPNEDSEIESRDKITFRPNEGYGYLFTSVGFKGKHKFTEELILPGPGDWSPERSSATETVKISSDKTKMTRTLIVDFDEVNSIGMVYGISENDPKGRYIFRFSLDDDLLQERSILIE